MNRIRTGTFLLLFLYIYPWHLTAQDSLGINEGATSPMVNKKLLAAGLVTGSLAYAGASAYLYHSGFTDNQSVAFHFFNDSKSFIQMDKFQHAFITYAASYTGYHFLRCAGVSEEKALLFGGPLGFLLASPKEIVDGFSANTGFSPFDFAANFAGSALFIGQELVFKDQIVKSKFSYSRSDYAEQANGYLGRNYFDGYFNDYNGHTYWLSINANRLIMRNKIPPWINIALGYSANGMFGAFENIESYNSVPIPETQRYRQYLLSLDVDWPRIKTRSGFVNALCKMLVFVKLPFPALEYNSKGELKGYWIYF